jgi:choline-sulfatase
LQRNTFRGQAPTWGTHLRKAGYYSRATGKMDLTGGGVDLGFDQRETAHAHAGGGDVTAFFRRPLCYRSSDRDQIDRSILKSHKDAGILPSALTFLRDDAPNRREPWVFYVGYYGPMPGFSVEQAYANRYKPEQVSLPYIPPGYFDNIPEPWEATRHYRRIATYIPEDRIRRAIAAYYGNVAAIDERIGQLLDQLDRSGMRRNTVVLLTSDHGRSLGEHGLFLHDEPTDNSARVPLMISGPGIPVGRRIATPVMHVDLFPTLLELGDTPVPSGLRGHSLQPLWQGKPSAHPGFAYTECHAEGTCTGSYVIRKGKWKYIHYTDYDSLLFDMEADPGELRNLIATSEGKKVSAELHAILRSLLDPMETTERGFATQEKLLQDLCARMTLAELLDFGFERRLGLGQAITLLKRYKKA